MAQDTLPRKTSLLYLEAGGACYWGSINYEYNFYSSPAYFTSISAGLSTYRIIDFNNKFNPDLLLPVMLHFCYGKKHYAEVGAGQVWVNQVYFNAENFRTQRKNNFTTAFSVGYRYQKNKRVMFRCNYSPFIEFNKTLKHWMGISIGYTIP